MDFVSKCTQTGLLLAAWPVKVLSLAPMKMFAWIAPGKLAAIMEANMNENMKKTGMKPDASFFKFIFSLERVNKETTMKIKDLWKESKEGNPALDSKLYNLETGEWVSLLSFAKPNRALVLNFGSCS